MHASKIKRALTNVITMEVIPSPVQETINSLVEIHGNCSNIRAYDFNNTDTCCGAGTLFPDRNIQAKNFQTTAYSVLSSGLPPS